MISRTVSFVDSDACLSYVPEFLAKTESFSNPLPRSFLAKSLSDFVAGLEKDLLLCPVRALHIYLCRTDSLLFSVASSSLLDILLVPFPRMPCHSFEESYS